MSRPRLAQVLAARRAQGRAAFIAYLTAGDPSLAATGLFLDALEEAGADVVELGVPFSDPAADGPVIQRACERALAAGATLAGVLDLAARYRARGGRLPLVLFTYCNPLLRMGLEAFAARAAAAGIDGVLAVDLPPEEAGAYRRCLAARGLDTVFLAAPTTTPERLRRIARAATGFVYYVSRLGVTGASRDLPRALAGELAAVRRAAGKPVAVGFGIARPEQARRLSRHADAVVVGSALVRLAEGRAPVAAARRIKALAGRLIEALGAGGRKTHGGQPCS